MYMDYIVALYTSPISQVVIINTNINKHILIEMEDNIKNFIFLLMDSIVKIIICTFSLKHAGNDSQSYCIFFYEIL